MMALPTNGRSALSGYPERRVAATAMTAKAMASVATIADNSKKTIEMFAWFTGKLYFCIVNTIITII